MGLEIAAAVGLVNDSRWNAILVEPVGGVMRPGENQGVSVEPAIG